MSTLPSLCCCGAGGPLQFATVLAYHVRWGFANFTGLFRDKYLHRLETTTITQATSNGTTVQTFVNEYDTDRLTGAVTSIQSSPGVGFIAFPFSSPPSVSDPAWVVQDTYFSFTRTGPVDFGTITIKQEVQVSKPYTMEVMDADAQALLDSVSIQSLTFSIPGTITPVSYDNFNGIPTDEATFDKDQYGHTVFNPNIEPNPYHLFPPSVFVPNAPDWNYVANGGVVALGLEVYSPAGYVYVPKDRPGANNGFDQPCGYAKWQSYVKGNMPYARKYNWFDLDQQPVVVQPQCESGTLVFTTPVRISPTLTKSGLYLPPVVGRNLYLTFQPNSQCP